MVRPDRLRFGGTATVSSGRVARPGCSTVGSVERTLPRQGSSLHALGPPAPARDTGLRTAVRCSSAGWDAARHSGAPADERTRRVLAWCGHANVHRAAQVADEHLGADLVVAMDRSDARKLTGMGVPAERLRLLRSFDPAAAGPDVANPYYGTYSDFEQLFAVIATPLPGLHVSGWTAAR
jgi:low molecular weight protein-tyrosine phosphatase